MTDAHTPEYGTEHNEGEEPSTKDHTEVVSRRSFLKGATAALFGGAAVSDAEAQHTNIDSLLSDKAKDNLKKIEELNEEAEHKVQEREKEVEAAEKRLEERVAAREEARRDDAVSNVDLLKKELAMPPPLIASATKALKAITVFGNTVLQQKLHSRMADRIEAGKENSVPDADVLMQTYLDRANTLHEHLTNNEAHYSVLPAIGVVAWRIMGIANSDMAQADKTKASLISAGSAAATVALMEAWQHRKDPSDWQERAYGQDPEKPGLRVCARALKQLTNELETRTSELKDMTA